MSILKLMDSQNLGSQKIPVTPQPENISQESSTIKPIEQPAQSPKAPVTPVINVSVANTPKDSKKAHLYLGMMILAVVALVVLFIVFQKNNNSDKLIDGSSSKTKTSSSSTTNPLDNPLNTGSQVNSQLKYCNSSPLAAEAAC